MAERSRSPARDDGAVADLVQRALQTALPQIHKDMENSISRALHQDMEATISKAVGSIGATLQTAVHDLGSRMESNFSEVAQQMRLLGSRQDDTEERQRALANSLGQIEQNLAALLAHRETDARTVAQRIDRVAAEAASASQRALHSASEASITARNSLEQAARAATRGSTGSAASSQGDEIYRVRRDVLRISVVGREYVNIEDAEKSLQRALAEAGVPDSSRKFHISGPTIGSNFLAQWDAELDCQRATNLLLNMVFKDGPRTPKQLFITRTGEPDVRVIYARDADPVALWRKRISKALANMASPSGSVVLVRYCKVASVLFARRGEFSIVWEDTQTLERAFGRSELYNARGVQGQGRGRFGTTGAIVGVIGVVRVSP